MNRKLLFITISAICFASIVLIYSFYRGHVHWSPAVIKNVGRTTPLSANLDTHLDDSHFELDQWQHFMNLNRQFPNPKIANVTAIVSSVFDVMNKVYSNFQSILQQRRNKVLTSYTYDITFRKRNASRLVVRIQEYLQRAPSNGGSGFFIRMSGDSLVVCTTQDHFDGNYTAFCPKTAGCSTVQIILQMTNYEVYRQRKIEDVKIPLMLTLKTFSWCSSDSVQPTTDLDKSSACSQATIGQFNKGIWWKRGSEYVWGTRDRCTMKHMNKPEIVKCFQKIRSLTFMGDSHMRNTGDYFLELLGYDMRQIPYHRHYDYNISKVGVLFRPYIPDMANAIRSLLGDKSRIRTSSDILVIMPGSWQFWLQGPVSYFNNSAYDLINAIHALRGSYVWKNTKIIWVHQIGFSPLLTHAGYRDNFVKAAANSWIEPQLKRLGIEPIDALYISYPRLDTTNVCGGHYLCRTPPDFAKSIGATGTVLAQLTFKYICEDS